MGSENQYEAGHEMIYHAYRTGSDNKDPYNNTQFYLGIAQSYLGHLCSHVSYNTNFVCLFCCLICCCFQKSVLFAQVFIVGTIYGPVHIKMLSHTSNVAIFESVQRYIPAPKRFNTITTYCITKPSKTRPHLNYICVGMYVYMYVCMYV